jgi:hypothetical protein
MVSFSRFIKNKLLINHQQVDSSAFVTGGKLQAPHAGSKCKCLTITVVTGIVLHLQTNTLALLFKNEIRSKSLIDSQFNNINLVGPTTLLVNPLRKILLSIISELFKPMKIYLMIKKTVTKICLGLQYLKLLIGLVIFDLASTYLLIRRFL